MPNKKNLSTNKNKEVKRDKNGRVLKGYTANPNGRHKGKFNSRTWYEARLKEELPELIDMAIAEIKKGNDKVLNFLLGRILPVKPILERENGTPLTNSAQENLINTLKDHNENRLSTEEANIQLTVVQKQIEIQQSDFVKLQNMMDAQNKMIEELRIQLNEKG